MTLHQINTIFLEFIIIIVILLDDGLLLNPNTLALPKILIWLLLVLVELEVVVLF